MSLGALGGMSDRLAFILSLDADGAIREMRRVGDTAERELGGVDDRLDRVGTRMQIVGTGALAMAGVAGRALWSLGQDASNLEQAVGGTTAVFGEAAATIDQFAETSADGFGLSSRAARELTSQLGAMLKGFGFTRQEAADTSVELAQLGADLSAAFGGAPEEAVQALGAALRGERDPIERYGVSINEAAVQQKALEMGLASSTSQLSANAKAQATLALIMEQTADIQGQFAREADTAAGQQARAAAEWENLRAEIGEGVLPAMNQLLSTGRDVIGFLDGLNDATGGSLGTWATYGTVAVGAAGAISLVGGTALRSVDNFRRLATAVRSSNLTMAGVSGPALVATAAIVGLTAAWQQNAQEAREAEERVRGWEDAIREAGNVTDGYEARLGQMVREHSDFADLIDRSGVSLEDLSSAMRGSDEEWEAFRDSMLAAAEAAGMSDRDINRFGAGLGVVRDEAAEAAGNVETANRVLDETVLAAEDAAGGMDSVAGSTGDAAAAARDAEQAQRDLTSAMADFVSDALGVEEATDAWVGKLGDLRDSVTENGPALDGNTEAALRNRSAMRDLVEAGSDRIRSLVEQGASERDIRTAQDLMVLELIDTARQLGLNNEQAYFYATTLANIPRTVNTTVNIEEILARREVTARGGPGETRARATGGFLEPGVPTFINDGDPNNPGAMEALVNRGGGAIEVLTAGRVARGDQRMTAAGGGGGLVLNVNLPHYVGARSDLMAEIDWWARTGGLDVLTRARQAGM